MGAVLTRHWKLGTLVFLTVLALCLVSVWQRQIRYNLTFSFSVHSITNRIELPTLHGVNSVDIANHLRLALQHFPVRSAVDYQDGAFTMTLGPMSAPGADRVQRDLATLYQQLTDQFTQGIDTAPLVAQRAALDAQLDLIAQTQRSTNLSAYEEYALKDRALKLGARRSVVAKSLEILSANIFGAPTIRLYPAEQLDRDVLLVLSLVLSGFVACALVVLVDFLGRARSMTAQTTERQ